MTARPLQDRIHVERLKPDEKSAGGIIFAAPDRPDFAKVIAIGPKVTDVAVGDTVILGKFAGSTVKFEGEPMLLVKEDEIFAVVEP
jgi:chaperonin GroES